MGTGTEGSGGEIEGENPGRDDWNCRNPFPGNGSGKSGFVWTRGKDLFWGNDLYQLERAGKNRTQTGG